MKIVLCRRSGYLLLVRNGKTVATGYSASARCRTSLTFPRFGGHRPATPAAAIVDLPCTLPDAILLRDPRLAGAEGMDEVYRAKDTQRVRDADE